MLRLVLKFSTVYGSIHRFPLMHTRKLTKNKKSSHQTSMEKGGIQDWGQDKVLFQCIIVGEIGILRIKVLKGDKKENRELLILCSLCCTLPLI